MYMHPKCVRSKTKIVSSARRKQSHTLQTADPLVSTCIVLLPSQQLEY